MAKSFQILSKLLPVHQLLLQWLELNDTFKFVWSLISGHIIIIIIIITIIILIITITIIIIIIIIVII